MGRPNGSPNLFPPLDSYGSVAYNLANMKRYRVLSFDFDSRATLLAMEIHQDWEEKIKEQHRENKENLIQELLSQYGTHAAEVKRKNLIDMGPKPFSILAFHNKFFEQIRRAFIMGSYYPALTSSCALGERILNHLVRTLREDFKSTPEYKKIYRKDSFANWDVPINTLESWQVLLPDVVKAFQDLLELRRRSIHFDPAVDQDDRPLALQAIKYLSKIIGTQFSAFGSQPWFIPGTPGESYIKKDAERLPFIKHIYLPNCRRVGPQNRIEIIGDRLLVQDNNKYENVEIADEEFRDLRLKRNLPKNDPPRL